MFDGKQVKNKSNPTGTGKYLDERGRYVDLPVGGISFITGTANFDFGKETDAVVVTISDVNLTNANFKAISFIPKQSGSTFLDDFSLNGLSFNIENIINNVSFDIRATASNNATGIYQIDYKIQY